MKLSRRQLLKMLGVGTVGASALGSRYFTARAQDSMSGYEPMFDIEDGASLRLLRWSGFVGSDEEFWNMNTQMFTDMTGVPVEIEYITWEDVRAKAALAASLGSGPDIVMGWYDDPHLYPDQLIDVTDLAMHLSDTLGGFEDVGDAYGYSPEVDHWISIPIGGPGNAMVYRESLLAEAGFDSFPSDWEGFLSLAEVLHGNGTPVGFALGRAVGDGNTWSHTLLWSFGGKIIEDDGETIAINSPETIEALNYVQSLYQFMAPGVSSWLDANNNRAFLGQEVSVTANGISVYVAAQNDFPELAADINHANMPIGPVGTPTELHLFTQAFIFNYSPAPNAAKEYLRFMLSAERAEPWVEAMSGYVTPALKAYKDLDVWTRDPKVTPYRDVIANMLPNSHAGRPGTRSAAALSEYIVLDMLADTTVNGMSPQDAARRAENRLLRIFR